MPIVPVQKFNSLRTNPLQGFEYLLVPLHYSLDVTTTMIAAIGNLFYRLVSPLFIRPLQT
ncbi:uncharacterized protein [Drosophila kikkawai]|uniref:Uncharacterized protein n=1 Tax=Drosophila kikkawai TaxID=30033 RepID=A0ABM3C6E5_DROKI|nr:uncharacterized protein LOC108079662 [Drosophila kikkawai]XP_041631889.1 uncharacterized protein LOC108079662 [Drosophila kikkawai]